MHLGYAPVVATRTVAADAAELDEYLLDPTHERRLLGAPVTVRPSRTAGLVTAHLATGRRAEVWATWILEPGRGSTDVTLAAQVEPRGVAMQIALLLGGRRRIARRVDAALATLVRVCAHHVEDVAPEPVLGARRPLPAMSVQQPVAIVKPGAAGCPATRLRRAMRAA